MKISVIITGATGMVGEGVLLECLQHPDVEKVLSLVRRTSGYNHPKLKEIMVSDFYDLTSIESELSGYDACFFCLGTTSVGKKEDEYRRITYDLTMSVAKSLSKANSAMTFCYVSGKGTDSSEQGRLMWARVKGKAENDLTKLQFKAVYNFRPGYMQPVKGQKYALSAYKYISWMYPVLRLLFPSSVCTLREVGSAMIHSVSDGYRKPIVEVKDIVELAAR